MTIAELITLPENKLMALNGEMSGAVQRGDVAEIDRLDRLVAETQKTLDTLRTAV